MRSTKGHVSKWLLPEFHHEEGFHKSQPGCIGLFIRSYGFVGIFELCQSVWSRSSRAVLGLRFGARVFGVRGGGVLEDFSVGWLVRCSSKRFCLS